MPGDRTRLLASERTAFAAPRADAPDLIKGAQDAIRDGAPISLPALKWALAAKLHRSMFSADPADDYAWESLSEADKWELYDHVSAILAESDILCALLR